MKTTIWMILLTLAIVTGNLAHAQEHQRPQRAVLKPELRKELATYQRQTIAPFLKTQRLELDKRLSTSDKRELADIREQLAQYRQHQMERVKQIREERKNRQAPVSEEQKAAIKAAREQHKAQMDRLTALAKRNEKHLAAIGEKVKPEQEKWKADLQAIAEKHGVSETEAPNRPVRKALHQAKLGHRWNANQFLLMDPYQTEFLLGNRSFENNQEATPSTVLQVTPNPVTNKATLSFQLAKEGHVKIDLVDQQGQVILQLVNQKFSAGKQEIPVQTNTLGNGVYFFRISTETTTESVRFLKQ